MQLMIWVNPLLPLSLIHIFAEAGLHGDNDILNLPYGAVIGKVTLVDCLPLEELAGYALDTPRERAFGNWSPGRYGWILSNPCLLYTSRCV